MDEIPSDFLASGSLESALRLRSEQAFRNVRGNLVGRQIGVYHVTALLGAGGMGEVYRARDTKLGRDVAIKVLPDAFADDAERRARFEREARVLAALNHPHIGAIYGFEEGPAEAGHYVRGLVLELVEGETLAERLAKGRLAVPQALNIARQIANALDAAHENGIVHRDLKPANIKITPDGTVKVLDFGLAKAVSGRSNVSDPGTVEGEIVGTAAYMSPEQARGQAIDKRTDIWAFGCVLYEMLTGTRAFGGATVSDTIAAVLDREPDWDALPARVPEAVRRLLHRCLDKDSMLRLRDIGDARLEIADTLTSTGSKRARAVDREGGRSRRLRAVWLAAALLIAVGVIGTVGWMIGATRQTPAEPIQFSFVPPPTPNPFGFSISPDGKLIAFVGTAEGGEYMMFVRPVGALDARPIPGTEGAFSRPFWSPDSRFMAFSTITRQLKIVSVSNGRPTVVVDQLLNLFGLAWNSESVLLFSSAGSLHRVAASGGVKPVTLTPRKTGERAVWPEFLPDGRHYLYVAIGRDGNRALLIGSLDSPEVSELMPIDFRATYAPNFILFTRQQTLFAQRFDASTRQLIGDPAVVVEGVLYSDSSNAAFSVSHQGTLVYKAGGADPRRRSLVWIDRKGTITSTPHHVGGALIELSPDGRRVAFADRGAAATEDIWVHDLERNQKVRLTSDSATDHWPVWSPDGSRVAFDSPRDGPANRHVIYERRADGATPERVLVPPEPGMSYGLLDWTADFIIFRKGKPGGLGDIWAQPLSGGTKSFPYLRNISEANAALSPDGRWLAYVTDEGGSAQTVVQSFPDSTQRREQISRNGGGYPRWRGDGRELFYLDADWKMIAVPLESDGTFSISKSQELFAAPGSPVFPISVGRPYDVTPDGQRFLFSVLTGDLGPTTPLTVVVNWPARLEGK